ncbi:MAG: division plane positioning ATPase MipZ [Erythrobacter sp.]
MTPTTAHRCVFANEKGGTGKSTTAVHVAVALSYLGARVTMLDLDPRQRTTHRYMENRFHTMQRRNVELPTPACEVFAKGDADDLKETIHRLEADCDFLIIDNPGRDDPIARAAVELGDTLVTPMNDSFVDFDLIGQVDPENFKVKKLSFFAELIWEARMKRSKATIEEKRPQMDWIVVRNRTGYTEARNMARIERALKEMSKRVGFRVVHGLSERVIYRELFPSGLTLLDKGHLGDLGTSHIVARQELRALVQALNLPEFAKAQPRLELA